MMPMKVRVERDVVKEMLKLPKEQKRLEDDTIRNIANDVAVKFQPCKRS